MVVRLLVAGFVSREQLTALPLHSETTVAHTGEL
jgi:hypothetical protein